MAGRQVLTNAGKGSSVPAKKDHDERVETISQMMRDFLLLLAAVFTMAGACAVAAPAKAPAKGPGKEEKLRQIGRAHV